MDYRNIFKIIGKTLQAEGIMMIIPIIIGLIYKDSSTAILSFLYTGAGLGAIGTLLSLIKVKNQVILPRASFIIVSMCWLLMALFGCLPLIISGEVPNFFDAFFEMCSGFTTTGASIIRQVEDLSKCTLFWRSFSHWIGGMGVIVFVLAIIPDKEGSRMHILRAESPGPQVGKLVSKVTGTARILYLIYIGLTFICFLLLLIGPDNKMDFFNAITITMGTAGTGGFAVLNSGLTAYTPYSQYVISIFMFLFGTNFTLFYLLLTKKFKNVLKNEELWIYIVMVLGSVAFISLTLYFQVNSAYPTYEEAFRHSLFQVTSIMSTTGYSTTDYSELWPSACKFILILLMITGPCAGSTGGGVKLSRFSILIKSSIQNIKKMVNPNKYTVIKSEGSIVEKDVIDNAKGFFILYIVIVLLSTFIISFDGFPLLDNFTASIACVSNIGPGLGVVGPMGNYADFSNLSKFILSLVMIAGRLELFPLLALFYYRTWKKN